MNTQHMKSVLESRQVILHFNYLPVRFSHQILCSSRTGVKYISYLYISRIYTYTAQRYMPTHTCIYLP